MTKVYSTLDDENHASLWNIKNVEQLPLIIQIYLYKATIETGYVI